MKSKRITAGGIAFLMTLAGLWLSASVAIGEEGEPAFMQHLFSPELVMQNSRAVELRAEQRKAITRAIKQTQSETLELQWAMQDAVGALGSEIGKDPIDEKAALAVAERMMEIEGRVKRAHLGLLIQIRNQLDPEQRARLRKIRDGG